MPPTALPRRGRPALLGLAAATAAAAVITALAARPAAAQVLDLGTLDTAPVEAHGVSAVGAGAGGGPDAPHRIVGSYRASLGADVRAFVWQNGSGMADLSAALAPTFANSANFSVAYAVNAAGLIVGTAHDGSASPRAFSYSAATGTVADLGTLGGNTSTAYGVNAAGAIVGVSDNGLEERAFLYDGGLMADLGVLSGHAFSAARGVNDAGQVVGVSGTGLDQRAFLHQAGAMTDLLAAVPQAQTGPSEALAISGSWVVGSYTDALGDQRAFRYDLLTATFADMGDLSGLIPGFGAGGYRALAVNASGLVVGTATSGTDVRAFLWDGQMRDLTDLAGAPTSGWAVLNEARGVSGDGWVVGWGQTEPSPFVGAERAFAVTSLRAPSSAAVPEPSTVALLLGAGVAVYVSLRRRRRVPVV